MAQVENDAISDELTKILVATGGLNDSQGGVEKTAAWYQHALRGARESWRGLKDSAKGLSGGAKGGAVLGGATGAVSGASGEDGGLGRAIFRGSVGALAGGAAGHGIQKGIMSTKSGKAAVDKIKDMKQYAFADNAAGQARMATDDAANIIAKAERSALKEAKRQAREDAKRMKARGASNA